MFQNDAMKNLGLSVLLAAALFAVGDGRGSVGGHGGGGGGGGKGLSGGVHGGGY